MRILDLCRGVAATGKSTWLAEHGLDRYALNADAVRLLFQSPVLQPDGTLAISQKNDKLVWEFIFQLLEARMARGEYTVIDATHSRAQQINDYRKLCEKYRYRCRVLDFGDTPLDVIQARNNSRLTKTGEEHKFVPDGAILNMYERIITQKPPGWVTVVKPSNYRAASELKSFDYNQYSRIHIVGDLHGCLTVFKTYLANNHADLDDPVQAFIFLGDYVDRGIENRELVEFLMSYRDHKNILFLAGNHDLWTQMFANDELDDIRSKEFIETTMPQLANVDKKLLREWCRRFAQLAWFTYRGTSYLCTHGGVPMVPTIYTATDEIIKGTGGYEDAEKTQEAWGKLDAGIQFHGHRNLFQQPLALINNCVNLCDKVEFGGDLRVAHLNGDGTLTLHALPNPVFAPEPIIIKTDAPTDDLSNTEMIAMMRAQPKLIQEKRFDLDGTPNKLGAISSFNFTRDVFWDKKWTPATVLAHGMFVNNRTGEIVARGYEKFFNINEREFTKIAKLSNMQFPVAAYIKENGFLGLVGYDTENKQAVITTRSSLTGDYLGWFKAQLSVDSLVVMNRLNHDGINACFVFECIEPERDPHIIQYAEPQLVLLDVIKRQVAYEKLNYRELCDIALHIRVNHKRHHTALANYRDFYEFYRATQEYDYTLDGKPVEGFVIEDQADFMVKIKTGYYNTWKFMRGIKEQILHKKPLETGGFVTALQNSFVAWLKCQDEATLELDIITLRNRYYKELS